MNRKTRGIGLIAFPICETGTPPEDARSGEVPFSHLVDILQGLYAEVYVITGNKERVRFKENENLIIKEVRHRAAPAPLRPVNYLFTQLKLAVALAQRSPRVDAWVFFIGAEALLLPALMAKLWRTRLVLSLTGFPSGLASAERSRLYRAVDFLDKLTLSLADRIIVYSERIVTERGLQKYRAKISLAEEHFLDLERFYIQKPLAQRQNEVAYIGRLQEGKGISNFLAAIADPAFAGGKVSFLIGGDGPQRDIVAEYAKNNPNLRYVGWIPHEELPGYLNEIKLLVLPSYTEALPNIILEAMACGTPVLTTAVGAIPDIIRDGETGFLLEDNSPDTITRNIARALQHPGLEKLAGKARSLVQKRYIYPAALANYRAALEPV